MTRQIVLTVPGSQEYASVIRAALGGVGILLDLSIDLLDDLRTAADEAVDCLLHQPCRAETLTMTCEPDDDGAAIDLVAHWSGETQDEEQMDAEITRGILETLIPQVRLQSENGSIRRITLRLFTAAAEA